MNKNILLFILQSSQGFFLFLLFLYILFSSLFSSFSSLFCFVLSNRNLEVFSTLIEFGSDVNSKCHGTPPLHLSIVTATLPSGYEFGLTCALKLIAEGCDLTAKVLLLLLKLILILSSFNNKMMK